MNMLINYRGFRHARHELISSYGAVLISITDLNTVHCGSSLAKTKTLVKWKTFFYQLNQGNNFSYSLCKCVFVCVCKDLSLDQVFSVQMELSYFVMFFPPALTSLMCEVRQLLGAVSLSFIRNLDSSMPFNWPQGKKKKKTEGGLVHFAWSTLKFSISFFFLLAYGAHYVSRVSHIAVSLL